MVPAVRPLGSLCMARGYARIDSRPDTAKMGSADRVEVHHARLPAVIGVRKTFPHGLGHKRKWRHSQVRSAVPLKADMVRRIAAPWPADLHATAVTRVNASQGRC